MKDDDFKLLRGFDDGQTDERTNGQTFVIVESLSRIKNYQLLLENAPPVTIELLLKTNIVAG